MAIVGSKGRPLARYWRNENMAIEATYDFVATEEKYKIFQLLLNLNRFCHEIGFPQWLLNTVITILVQNVPSVAIFFMNELINVYV